MGTTESVFAEEELPEVSTEPSSEISHHESDETQRRIVQHRPPSSSRRAPPVPPAPNRRRLPSSEAAANGKRPPGPPIFRMKGLVLGMENSGKRTLLQRFEGKDPFSSQEATSSTTLISSRWVLS